MLICLILLYLLHSTYFFFLLHPPAPTPTLFPYTTLFRSLTLAYAARDQERTACAAGEISPAEQVVGVDRKSTRLNSSHLVISYAVFCLKKKRKTKTTKE